MKKNFFLLLMLLPAWLCAQDEARLLRFPATNGKDIVFTYAGDLYTVPVDGGLARKLTSHIGFEMFAHFSPDGQNIAFTAQYDGNTEVYSMPANGGNPKRLTYTATLNRDDVSDRMGPNNIVMTWTPDGKSVVYRSRKQSFGFRAHLFNVPAEGGLSTQVPLPEGGFCSYAPDGKNLAYNRVFREFRTWKYYEGGMADDVWIYDFNTNKTTNITKNNAQDICPMWIGDEIFFISDRDRSMNLFAYNTKTKQTEKVTNYTDFDIKFPTFFGDDIVYENGGYICRFNAKTRKAEKIRINIANDFIYARNEWKDVSKNITSAELSPDGERLVITARGEVYNVPAKEGVTRNLTASSGIHERGAEWSPNGKWIAYISDKSGETELYLQSPENYETTQLTNNNDSYINYFTFSPDSKKIVYMDRKNRIRYIDIDSKQMTEVARDEWGMPSLPAFSPDSKWLTYALSQSNKMDVIYVYNIAEKKQYPVTDKWYNSSRPVFSQDGKYLFFISSRDFNPSYGRTEWNFIYTDMDKVYIAILSKDTPSPFAGKDDEVKIMEEQKPVTSQENKTNTNDKPDSKQSKKTTAIKIDTDGIGNRIIALPVNPGNYFGLFSLNDKVYYASGRSAKVFDLKTKKETEIGEGMSLTLSPNGKKVLVRQRGSLYVTDVPSEKLNVDKAVDLSGIKTFVNFHEEWEQIFNESWRIMRDGFYVRNMHGVDWPAMRKKYEALLPYVNHRADLTYIIGEMIGELNVGHAYVNSGEMPKPERIKTGLLGAKISRDKSGYFLIDEILEGANWSTELRSPLTEIGVNAKKGDYIVSVDGVPAQKTDDIYRLLVGKANEKVLLEINSKPSATGSRKVVVTPLADESQLYYYNWIQENMRKVEKATNGRVGYIHIPDMGVEGLNEFAKYFYSQLDKEALIIDDRSNGGGNVSPMILERLARIPYRATAWSSSDHPGTVPDATLVGPKIVIVDKYSMSDGDLFPYGFKELGLGKLVGTRTWGGIVGISGSLPFIDGADMRVPFFTSYSMKTGEWIIEGHGVDPDIVVDNDPYKEWTGEDEQLNRAIEEIMKDLQNRKGIPPIPAGLDKTKKK